MGEAKVGTAHGFIAGVPRSDGYLTITEPIWRWAQFRAEGGRIPTREQSRYVLSVARRCDAAHHQFERVREGIAHVEAGPENSIEWRQQLYDTLGDAELAMVALHRAVEMAACFRTQLRTTTPFPVELESKRETIKRLRDAYEHIEARAMGLIKVKGKRVQDPDAHTGMSGDALVSLFNDRTVTYAGCSFGVDQEATNLLMGLRRYILDAWGELTGPSPG